MKEQILSQNMPQEIGGTAGICAGLTVRAENPYAKDGSTIFMSENMGDQNTTTPEATPIRNAWKEELGNDYNDPATRQTVTTLERMGIAPKSKPSTETVRENAALDDKERLKKAREALGQVGKEPLTSEQETAILKAHAVGGGETGKDGNEAGVYNYTFSQLREKARILDEGGITDPAERRALMEAGIVGEDESGLSEEKKNMLDIKDETIAEGGLRRAGELEANLKERLSAADEDGLKDFLSDDGSISGQTKRIAEKWADRNVDAEGVSKKDAMEHFTEEFIKRRAEAQAVLAKGDVEGAKKLTESLITDLINKEREYWRTDEEYRSSRAREKKGGRDEKKGGRERMTTVNDFDDVLAEIIQFDPKTYDDNGESPLYKTVPKLDADGNAELDESGKPIRVRTGEINEGNFKKWVQERMVHHSEFDPDAPIQFFQAVAIENNNLYRGVSLGMMVNNHTQYFRRKEGMVDDPDKQYLEKLYKEITDMGWVDGKVRNNDALYRVGMSQDTKFADMFMELFKDNTLGKEATRTGLNTLANMFMMDEEFDPEKGVGEGDMKIGEATASSFLFYYNMTDLQELRNLFGTNLDTFFSYDAFQRSIDRAMLGKERNPKDKAERDRFIKEAELDNILKYFDKKEPGGSVVDEKDRINFLLDMNVFSPPSKNRFQITIARNLVRQVAGLESGLLEEGKITTEAMGKVSGTLDYGEMRAMWLSYQMGAAARQDVGVAAVNAMSKVTQFLRYLNKQVKPSRAGGIGNPHEIGLLKSIAADPMTGVLTVSKETTLSLLKELHMTRRKPAVTEEEKIKRREDIRNIMSRWAYPDIALRQYPGQNVGNSFKEFHDRTSGKEIHLDSFSSYDMNGHVVYDTQKMISEVQEGLIKPSRYRWSTHELPYWEMRRVRTDLDKKIPEYEDQPYAAEVYGEQVLEVTQKMLHNEWRETLKHGKPEDQKKLRSFLETNDLIDEKGKFKPIIEHGKFLTYKDEHGNTRLSKGAEAILREKDFGRVATRAYLLSKFAVQLWSSTRPGRGHKYLDYGTRERIITALGMIPADIHIDPHDFRHSHATGYYFSSDDLELLREMSENGKWKNFHRAIWADLRLGALEGAGKSWKQFWKGVFS